MTTIPSSPSEYFRAARAAPAGLRLAVLASFNADLLRPYVVVEAAQIGALVSMWTGPFGQFEQQIMADGSELWHGAPQVGLIFARVLDIEPDLVYEPSATARGDRLAAIRQRVVGLAREFRARSSAPVLVANFCLDRSVPDLFDASQPDGLVHAIAAANQSLAAALAPLADVHVFDYAGVVARVGAQRFVNRKLWTLAKSAASTPGQIALAHDLARAVRALSRAALKCIVVDLDNTLWGGVVGDDGIGGLKLGTDGAGAPFHEFQRALKALRGKGFLLAIASKNDPETALEALKTHPEMVLRPDDFAAMAISWDPKPAGIEAITRKLNLGLDALLFVDDNPVECAQVRAALPSVQVLQLPQDPLGFAEALLTTPGLERPRVLAEDRQRANMVAADTARSELRDQAPSLAGFLRELGMVAHVGVASGPDIERIHQLIQKTNQWNLTTRRHPLDEVRRLATAADAAVAWLRLEDRYGDLGLVCVGILRATGENVEIDTLLMSCRVMGREVEDAFLAYLAELARRCGARRLQGVFRRTAKNALVESFYQSHQFTLVENGDDGQRWERSLADEFVWPNHIARRDVPESK